MALSDKPTQLALRTSIQLELLDSNALWWTTSELDGYIADWQALLQSEYEFAWGTATATLTTSGTNTITAIATDILRLDAVYAQGTAGDLRRLSPRDQGDLDLSQNDWRTTTGPPEVIWQPDAQTLCVWPLGTSSLVCVFEYPKLLAFAGTGSAMQLPAWTRFTCIPYACFRAYSRFGPNQDLPRAARYRRRWDADFRRLRRTYDAYLPKHAPKLRPGRQWASDILSPRRAVQVIPQNH